MSVGSRWMLFGAVWWVVALVFYFTGAETVWTAAAVVCSTVNTAAGGVIKAVRGSTEQGGK